MNTDMQFAAVRQQRAELRSTHTLRILPLLSCTRGLIM